MKCCRLSWDYHYALLHNCEESKSPETDQTTFFGKQYSFCSDSHALSFCYLALSLLLSTWDLLSNNSLVLVWAQDSCRAQCNKKSSPTCCQRVFGFPDIQIQPSCCIFADQEILLTGILAHDTYISCKVCSMLIAQTPFWRTAKGLVNFYQ